TSVLPTPASPSRNRGRSILSARNKAVARLRSAIYAPAASSASVSSMEPGRCAGTGERVAMMVRRIVPHIFAAAAAVQPVFAAAQPAVWPAKPVRVIVPFSAGSPVEIPARPVTQRLAETFGQQFVIDNRPGASGTIGTELVAKALRDGYTLLYTN